MKKSIIVLTILTVLFLTFFPVFAAQGITVKVGGNTVNFPDAQPFINSDSRTMIPIRSVAETLGATVLWDGDTKTVTIIQGKTIKLTIGQKIALVDGVEKTFDTAAIIKENRTFVPLRFISEALGATVNWDGSTGTVIITTSKDTKVVNGYTVPMYPTVTISLPISDDTHGDIDIDINLDKSIEKQYQEAQNILSSKFGLEFANQVLSYVKQKKTRTDTLKYKEFNTPNGENLSVASGWRITTINISVTK